MRTGRYSDGSSQLEVIEISEDTHAERSGLFRAYWTPALPDGTPDPDATSRCTVFGYCDSKGSKQTIGACIAEVQRYYPQEPVYRIRWGAYRLIAPARMKGGA